MDLCYQHCIDPRVPIEIVLETLRLYVVAGTIRWFGLCECSAETPRRAKVVKGIGQNIIAVQMEYSAFALEIEKSGFAKTAAEQVVGM